MNCDICGKEAIVNYQKVWTRYDVKDGDYFVDNTFDAIDDIAEPTGDDNRHFCRKHEIQWLAGEID
jgi:hypothetical protein